MIWTVLLAVVVPSLTFALQEVKQCPWEEDLKSCRCSSYYEGILILKCKPRDVNEFRNELVNFRGARSVKIKMDSSWMMKKIPSDLFKGVNVNKLEFEDHNIIRFGDEGRSSFEGLEDTLEELYIKGMHVEKPLVFLNISALNVLHTLDINFRENQTSLNDIFAKGPVSLKKLKIICEEISEIGNKVFEKLVNLEFLELSEPSLKFNSDIFHDIRRSMFPSPAPYLKHLILRSRSISSLPEDMFVDMPSLRKVELYGKISRLPEATWSAVWSQLEVLNIGAPLSYTGGFECDSHIEWMFRRRSPDIIRAGDCSVPKYYRMISLERLISQKSKKFSSAPV